jgi:hypothetical protein
MEVTKGWFTTFLLLLSIPFLSAPLFAQPVRRQVSPRTDVREVSPSPDELPKVLVYRILFGQVAMWEQIAKRDSFQHVSDRYREAVGLSGKKLKTFRSIALECHAETERYGALISAQARAEMAAGSTSPTPGLQQLDHDSDEAVLLAIDDIREALGADLFEKTDRRIRAYIGSRIHMFVPTRPGVSAK